MMSALVLAFVAAALAQTPAPKSDALKPEDAPANYGLCLDTARAYPQQGLDLARRWEGLGGGAPAKHCEGVALIGLMRNAEAGLVLETVAATGTMSADVRAGLFAQAGQAWLAAGDTAKARAAQTAALALLPAGAVATVPILIDRAITAAQTKQYADAVADLTAALAIQPGSADALALRANALHELGRLDDAAKDAQAAVAADGSNLNALLERGIVARLQGRADAARRDWEKIVALAPQSDVATVARGHLERLEAGPEAEAPVKKSKKKR
jgi:tetratricopeptide (TPR) repeat protein